MCSQIVAFHSKEKIFTNTWDMEMFLEYIRHCLHEATLSKQKFFGICFSFNCSVKTWLAFVQTFTYMEPNQIDLPTPEGYRACTTILSDS